MRHPLTETFGLDTNCFVCDQRNESGLRILYHWDDEDQAFAATAELRISYLAPVPVGEELSVTGRLVGRHKSQIWVIVQVRVGETVAARAEARCTVMGDELRSVAGVRESTVELSSGR